MEDTKMSTIKTTYDNVEDIPEGMETIYTHDEATGRYNLPQVEGMVAKTRLDEFRDNNLGLRQEVEGYDDKLEQSAMALDKMRADMTAMEEKFSGVDLNEWSDLQAERKAMADKELIDKGDVDTLINNRVDEVLAAQRKVLAEQKDTYESQILGLQEDLVNYDGQLNVMVVDNELAKIAGQHGVRASAMEDLMSRGRSVFRVQDGNAVAFQEDGRQMYMEDAVTPLSIDGWIEGLTSNAPHLFEASTGASISQPTNSPAPAAEPASTHDSIKAGLANLNDNR